ncbi:response regulator [Aeromonas caviae]|uniref:response regulator n=1 Tax=Aeromonas caviae TaxID=648 RepID=UPI0038D20107
MIRILLFFLCWGGVTSALADEHPVQQLQLFSRDQPANLNVTLNDEQWRWLGTKVILRIGTWAPENPPFDTVPEAGIYDGIYSDYIMLIARNLGVKPQIIRYASRTDALKALIRNEIDTVVDDSGSEQVDTENYTKTHSFITNRPALVTREYITPQERPNKKNMTLALAQGYLSDKQAIQYFPHAKLIRFPSNQSALTCVSLGKCNAYIGNLTTASFLIEQNYSNELVIKDIYPAVPPGTRFLLRNSDFILKNAMNAVLQALPEVQHQAFSRQWVQRQDIWRFDKPLDLTEKEKKWIKSNPTIRVVINPFLAPYMLLGKNREWNGISADILRLIHLRTGLNFKIVEAHSAREMFAELKNHEGDLIGAVTINPKGENFALFSRPWHKTPMVLVVKDSPTAPIALGNNLTLAAVSGNVVEEQLAKEWPGIRWVSAENASLALQMVNSGKVDGAISNYLSANFIIDRYFSGKLKIIDRVSEEPAQIGFAVRRDAPELLEILNKSLADILPQEISIIIHRWQGIPDTPINTWELYDQQFYWLLAAAAGFSLLVLIWVYIRDKEVRLRRKEQETLQNQLNFRDTLINGSPTPIYFLNRQFTILTYNEAYLRYFSKVHGGKLYDSLFDQRHPLAHLRETLELVLTQNEQAATSGTTQEFLINNGVEERVIAHWAIPFVPSHQDEVTGLICGWQDITGQRQLLQALSVEKELAEQANQAKSTFLATMSHEIRTPISAILGLLEIEIQKQPENDAIMVAFDSAQTLMGLIGDVLDMAKIESGQLELSPQWLPLDQLISPVIKVFEEVARQKRLSLHFTTQIESGLEVFIDGGRLRQAVANYLSNAVKFTEKGRIDVRLQSQRTSPDALLLNIEIEDTGVGISLTDQKKLFKPFSQLSEGRRQTGSGLGLVISSQLLEKMHGSMQMRSSPGRGTIILIELALNIRPRQNTVESGMTLRSRLDQQLSVLIIDDHPVNLMVLGRQLTLLGHLVTEAKSGAEGLTKWRNGKFDLIITDCTMPEMDGFTLSQRIRAAGGELTIFGLTANAQSDVREKGISAGMNDCLFKPLRLSQLENILLHVVKQDIPSELSVLINLPELQELLHQDEDMLSRLLLRMCEENAADLEKIWETHAVKDWRTLASYLHKLGGAAQVIYAVEIDTLCSKIEDCCIPPVNEIHLKQQLLLLDNMLNKLHHAIKAKYQP